MSTTVRLAFALAAGLIAVTVRAQEPAGSLVDVTGEWVMEIEGHQMPLELDQKGETVEGVMQSMGRRILLVGTYKDRALLLKGERPEDGAGFAHGREAEAKSGPIVATMKDDGSLDGELSTNRGRTKWVGTRFKKR